MPVAWLAKGMSMIETEEDVFENAPALSKPFVPPPPSIELAADALNTPPARFLNVPLENTIGPSPHEAAPAFSIALARNLLAGPEIERIDVGEMRVRPLPVMSPPAQDSAVVEKAAA